MARSPSGRRGRGSSDFGGTLGSLLRSTWEQAGAVREVIERAAGTGKARLDEALGDRKRSQALAELGEIVLELVRQGEIDLAELPEIRGAVRELDRIDAAEPRDDLAEPTARSRSGRPTTPRPRFDERDVIAGRARQPMHTEDEPEDLEGPHELRALAAAERAGPRRHAQGEEGDEGDELDDDLEQDPAIDDGLELDDGLDADGLVDIDEAEAHAGTGPRRAAVTQRMRSHSEPPPRRAPLLRDPHDERDPPPFLDEEEELSPARGGVELGADERDPDEVTDVRDVRDGRARIAPAAQGARPARPARDARPPRDPRDGLRRRTTTAVFGGSGESRRDELRASRARTAETRPGHLRRSSDDDGTVPSSSWSASRRSPLATTQRVWRPVLDESPEPGAPGEAPEPGTPGAPTSSAAAAGSTAAVPGLSPEALDAPPAGRSSERSSSRTTLRPAAASTSPPAEPEPIPGLVRFDDLPAAQALAEEPPRPSSPFRSGGISFDDDDLEEYMHPDDVPSKPTPS